MKKNILCVIAFLAFGCCTAFGQHQFVVELNSSNIVRFVLSDYPVVTFSGTKVYIKSAKAEAVYDRSAVSKYYFDDAVDDIAEVTIPSSELRIEYTSPEYVRIYGLTQSDNIKLYDITGKQLPADSISSDVALTINLSPLSSGVYIIALPNHQSIKIKK